MGNMYRIYINLYFILLQTKSLDFYRNLWKLLQVRMFQTLTENRKKQTEKLEVMQMNDIVLYSRKLYQGERKKIS